MDNDINSYQTITPYLLVKNADAALTFLITAFGGRELMCQRDDAGAVRHAEVMVGDTKVMLGQCNEEYPALSGAFYVWVPDVDAAYARALAAGATSTRAPEDMPYGHRSGGVRDSNGLEWWLAAPVAR